MADATLPKCRQLKNSFRHKDTILLGESELSSNCLNNFFIPAIQKEIGASGPF